MGRLAGNDQDLQRYVLGYVSHMGTDVAGHPFVNAIVGGPYRTHWHRYKLVEGWIDAYARRHYPDTAQMRSCFNLQSHGDKYRADAVAGSYYYRLTEFPNDRLPAKLAGLFETAMRDTYGSITHPPMLSADDVDLA